ncbi:MAG: CPBP family intramembrane glutamic endopeptidase [Terracidiphilus sp.]
MQSPENDSTTGPPAEPPQALAVPPRTLAPAWHTVVLIVGILALSICGSSRLAGLHGSHGRLVTYATTALLELVMLGWVAFGLRLRGIPLRSLLGAVSGGFHGVALDAGIAFAFWIGSLMILGTLGILWSSAETALTHQQAATRSGQPFAPSPSQQRTVRELEQLAPANAEEIVSWVALCMLVGFVEESVFRGYLQGQFTAWARGGATVGVVFSALLFGAAHGYQGVRNMVLLAVFGALFSLLSIFRRSLRSCIFAHSWQDLVAGLALGFLRSHHVL